LFSGTYPNDRQRAEISLPSAALSAPERRRAIRRRHRNDGSRSRLTSRKLRMGRGRSAGAVRRDAASKKTGE